MVGSSEEALDLTQEAFMRAWQALPQWQPDAKFGTWLFRIGSNAALDLLRRRRAVEFVPYDGTPDLPHAGAGPERQVELQQEVRLLERALARLSPEHRQILLLREVENLPYEEIAQVLSVGEGTVKSRLARARMALIEESRKGLP
jgi:RNA polymerase sigma-70 factor (ECF subfamily)